MKKNYNIIRAESHGATAKSSQFPDPLHRPILWKQESLGNLSEGKEQV